MGSLSMNMNRLDDARMRRRLRATLNTAPHRLSGALTETPGAAERDGVGVGARTAPYAVTA
jgi:hypothetical protein